MKTLAWVGLVGFLAVGCGTIGADPLDGGGPGGTGGGLPTGAAGHANGGSSGPGGVPGTAGTTGVAGTQGVAGQGPAGAGGAAGTAGAGGAAGTAGAAAGGRGGAAGSGTGRGGAAGGGTAGGAGGAVGRGGTGGGGAGGAVGRGGTGGGDTTCDDLQTAYAQALMAARQCHSEKPDQCLVLASTSLACPGCQIHVNDGTKIDALTRQWVEAGCDRLVRVCPAIACIVPTGAGCVPIDSGDFCMEGKPTTDPVPPASL
jgi:hypothetical protein